MEKFFERTFLEDFFGRIFLGGFFWEDFFGRNYLVEQGIDIFVKIFGEFCLNAQEEKFNP